MTYTRIRIDRDTVIKVPTRTAGTGEGTLYLYFSETFDPHEVPLECGGEIADALRGWISGSKLYPVTGNGVLNVYGSIVEGLEASRALNGEPINFPLVNVGTMLNEVQDGPYVGNIKANEVQGLRMPLAVPQIDVDAIARAIKDRR